MALIDKKWFPGKPLALMEIWIARGGTGRSGNSGPSGCACRPAALRYRALAEMAAAHRTARGLRARMKGAAA